MNINCLKSVCGTQLNNFVKGETSKLCIATSAAGVVLMCALFVIGSMAAAGTFHHSGSVLGWTTVGLGLGAATLFVISAKKMGMKKIAICALAIIFAATFVTLGTLGGMGILRAKELGYAIIGTSIGGLLLYIGMARQADRAQNMALLEKANRASSPKKSTGENAEYGSLD